MQGSGNYMITDAALQVAAEEVAMAMLHDVPAEPHTFSARFEKKMKRLLHRAKHPVGYQVVRYAAAVLLAITVLFGAAFAASPEVRAAVVNWVKTVFPRFVGYTPEDTNPPDTEYEYVLPEVFDGYSLLTTIEDEAGKTYVYTNSLGEILQFYCVQSGHVGMFVEIEKCDVYNGMVGELPADIYISRIDGESNAIAWQDPTNNMLFVLFAHMDRDELQKIVEKVEKREIN